jgi:N-acetyl-anhydromuramyl-L-alanine amidase AmpD
MNRIYVFSLFLFLFSYTFIGQNKNPISINKMPIVYNQERIKLSLEYLKERHNLIQSTPTIVPKIIVLHYVGGGTLKSSFNYFNNIRIENGREYNKKQSQLNVSAHYLVDRDGEIYQLLSDTLFARHTIGLNYCAIGVENIGGKDNPLTEKQIIANAKLVRYLKSKYPIEYVIGHSEYGKFRKSKLWKETSATYFTGKEDPGVTFMQKVRILIKDLNLKYEP